VIELWWTLEEDEPITPTYVKPSSRDQPGIVSFSVTSTISPRPVGPNFRKRSRTEAYARAELITGMATSAGQVFPIARPYTTLFNLTFSGLVLVDPLNLLEGIS
jgi:hypothetical protein